MATKADETLSNAMAAAFAEIEAATKDAENPAFKQGGRAIRYADLSSVIAAIKPPLIAHKLFFTQHCHPSPDGVEVETVLGHAGGEEKSLGRLFVPANKRDAQGFGSALTYARRYALMTAFGVPAEDDDGSAATKAVANDTNGNGGDRQTPKRDLPFPQGPAKNVTQLKEQGRDLWRQVEGCGDDDELSALIASHGPLIRQLREALPQWWDGYQKDGTTYPGLGEVITKKQAEFGSPDTSWQRNPLIGG